MTALRAHDDRQPQGLTLEGVDDGDLREQPGQARGQPREPCQGQDEGAGDQRGAAGQAGAVADEAALPGTAGGDDAAEGGQFEDPM